MAALKSGLMMQSMGKIKTQMREWFLPGVREESIWCNLQVIANRSSVNVLSPLLMTRISCQFQDKHDSSLIELPSMLRRIINDCWLSAEANSVSTHLLSTEVQNGISCGTLSSNLSHGEKKRGGHYSVGKKVGNLKIWRVCPILLKSIPREIVMKCTVNQGNVVQRLRSWQHPALFRWHVCFNPDN